MTLFKNYCKVYSCDLFALVIITKDVKDCNIIDPYEIPISKF